MEYIHNNTGECLVEVADLAIKHILGLARETFTSTEKLGKALAKTSEFLLDKTIGIVGLGDIGLNISKRAKWVKSNRMGSLR